MSFAKVSARGGRWGLRVLHWSLQGVAGRGLERGVERVDQTVYARVAAEVLLHLIHRVAEADAGVEVGVAEGASGAGVTERARVWSQGHEVRGQHPAESKARLDLQAGVRTEGLLDQGVVERFGVDDVNAVDAAALAAPP